jgi:predicted nuclease of predicted toxin-antitoxin system
LDVNLGGALDSEICRHAEREGRIIVSKDQDFFYLA